MKTAGLWAAQNEVALELVQPAVVEPISSVLDEARTTLEGMHQPHPGDAKFTAGMVSWIQGHGLEFFRTRQQTTSSRAR
jgi:hypothetical protein